MSGLFPTAHEMIRAGEPCALITVIETKGSVPREAGTRMLVTTDRCMGTIGGGQLEYRAVDQARTLLQQPDTELTRSLHSYTLGPELKQCCGGVVNLTIDRLGEADAGWLAAAARMPAGKPGVLVGPAPQTGAPASSRRFLLRDAEVFGTDNVNSDADLVDHALDWLANSGSFPAQSPAITEISIDGQKYLLEALTGPSFHLYLFGAGHVGKALVQVLAPYPCRITWVDSRAEEFPVTVPANTETQVAANPAELVGSAPKDAYYLVMTHSHPLDFELCKTVLNRDFAYLGLIGSRSKRARFRKNLRLKGVDPGQLERLTCPIGIGSIRGKHPAAIAVAVAAQLIELCERREARATVTSEEPVRAEA